MLVTNDQYPINSSGNFNCIDDYNRLLKLVSNDIISDMYYDPHSNINPYEFGFLTTNDMVKKPMKKIKAQIKGNQFLVVGNDSYNLEQLTKFEVKEGQIVIVLGALTYAIYEQNVKNFNDIPDIIYGYFEHKHGKNISNG